MLPRTTNGPHRDSRRRQAAALPVEARLGPTRKEAVRVKRMHSLVLVGALGAALSLSACGSSDSDGGNSGSDNSSKAGKVGVILPDTESSVRWETADRPALAAAFEAAGVDYEIQNAEGDADKMTQIADSMITSGVTVLAIVNL